MVHDKDFAEGHTDSSTVLCTLPQTQRNLQRREHSPLTAGGMIQILVTSDLQLALENMESVSAEERRLRAEGEVPLTEEGATRRYSQLCELGRAEWSPHKGIARGRDLHAGAVSLLGNGTRQP